MPDSTMYQTFDFDVRVWTTLCGKLLTVMSNESKITVEVRSEVLVRTNWEDVMIAASTLPTTQKSMFFNVEVKRRGANKRIKV